MYRDTLVIVAHMTDGQQSRVINDLFGVFYQRGYDFLLTRHNGQAAAVAGDALLLLAPFYAADHVDEVGLTDSHGEGRTWLDGRGHPEAEAVVGDVPDDEGDMAALVWIGDEAIDFLGKQVMAGVLPLKAVIPHFSCLLSHGIHPLHSSLELSKGVSTAFGDEFIIDG